MPLQILRTPRRAAAAVALALLAATTLAVVTDTATAPAAHAAKVTKRLRAMIRALPRSREVRRGYDRDKFDHWVDADGDGCDTRDEVLIKEARRRPTVGSGCSLSGGKWFSWYDGETSRDTSDFDIDHMVPLAESWDSGARRWSSGTRKRFANDLRDRRSLTAVTDNSNSSKSDRDPAEWLPPRQRVHCRYVRHWVAVKTRWRLTVNNAEKRTLRREARDCRNVRVTVRTARVVRR